MYGTGDATNRDPKASTKPWQAAHNNGGCCVRVGGARILNAHILPSTSIVNGGECRVRGHFALQARGAEPAERRAGVLCAAAAVEEHTAADEQSNDEHQRNDGERRVERRLLDLVDEALGTRAGRIVAARSAAAAAVAALHEAVLRGKGSDQGVLAGGI